MFSDLFGVPGAIRTRGLSLRSPDSSGFFETKNVQKVPELLDFFSILCSFLCKQDQLKTGVSNGSCWHEVCKLEKINRRSAVRFPSGLRWFYQCLITFTRVFDYIFQKSKIFLKISVIIWVCIFLHCQMCRNCISVLTIVCREISFISWLLRRICV